MIATGSGAWRIHWSGMVWMSASALLAATLLAGALAYLALAVHVWTIRRVRGATPLAVLLLAAGVWALAYAQEFSSIAPERIAGWADLELAASCAIVPALWAFVLGYTGAAPRLRRPLVGALLIEPVVLVTLLVVPGGHHLVHSLSGGPDLLIPGRHDHQPADGVLHDPHVVYLYTLVGAAVALLVVRLAKVTGPSRRQSLLMIASILLPFVGSVCFTLGLMPDGSPDPAVLLLIVTGVVLVWGFFRLRLVDLIPGAWRSVVERLPDAVLVVDDNGRLLDSNPAAARLLGPSFGLGADVRTALPYLAPVFALDPEAGSAVRDLVVPALPLAGNNSAAGAGAVAGILEAQVTAIGHVGAAERARVVVLRDVTARRATEKRLRAVLREQTEVARILAQCLQPAALPVVPGLDVAARSVPGDQAEPTAATAGGAFRDVHRTGDGGWALCLGEVAGRDVRAAALTALARSTLRMFGAQALSPADVMAGLNRVLMADPDGARMCATAYVRTDSDPDPADVVVRVAVGADTPPLLRHPDGTVEVLDCGGPVLGMMPDVTIPVREVRLAPGAVLLLYTGGLVGSRFHSERFGADRLTTAIRLAPATAAGVVDAVLDAVRAFATQTDDIAVLALAPEPTELRAGS